MQAASERSLPVRRSAFKVSQVLGSSFRPSGAGMIKQGQEDKHLGPMLPVVEQEGTVERSEGRQEANTQNLGTDSLISVAKSIMQASGTGCPDVVELLSRPPR